jgi:hypothetical protein
MDSSIRRAFESGSAVEDRCDVGRVSALVSNLTQFRDWYPQSHQMLAAIDPAFKLHGPPPTSNRSRYQKTSSANPSNDRGHVIGLRSSAEMIYLFQQFCQQG